MFLIKYFTDNRSKQYFKLYQNLYENKVLRIICIGIEYWFKIAIITFFLSLFTIVLTQDIMNFLIYDPLLNYNCVHSSSKYDQSTRSEKYVKSFTKRLCTISVYI